MTDKRKHPAHVPSRGLHDARLSLPGTIITEASGIRAHPLTPKTVRSGQGAANDSSASNPCLSCGACCAHFRVSFYCGEIAGESGGTVPPELVTQISPLRGCMKGTENGGQRCIALRGEVGQEGRSEEHTSELQSLMRISYAVYCLKK